MSINKSYAVFGLGRYGFAVAKELIDSGAEVLAIDNNINIVNEATNHLPLCKCADITDIDTLTQLGIANIDVVIIAMASNLEASVLAVTLCKELGVENVIAKAASEMHQKILLKVGADKVVFPERESGIRLAKNLLSRGFVDIVELTKGVSMLELSVRPEWIGKNLLELNLRRKYSINIVAICINDEVNTFIDPSLPLNQDMKLIVVANTDKISKLK